MHHAIILLIRVVVFIAHLVLIEKERTKMYSPNFIFSMVLGIYILIEWVIQMVAVSGSRKGLVQNGCKKLDGYFYRKFLIVTAIAILFVIITPTFIYFCRFMGLDPVLSVYSIIVSIIASTIISLFISFRGMKLFQGILTVLVWLMVIIYINNPSI